MEHSVAVIIFNEESENRSKLDIILKTFHRMKMKIEVLVNETAEKIQEAVKKLTELDDEEILDIIFVIHAKQVNDSDRKFTTVDRKILDIYDNIIFYILEVEEFGEKQKIMFFNVSGCDSGNDLEIYKPKKEFECTSYGSNFYILLSNKDKFVESVFPDLGKHRNLSRVVQKNKDLFETETFSQSAMILKVPLSNSERTSEFHEFVIG